ncbi:MAG: bi-domain-containing oxidoreductase [Chloroflexi bacterium]|nr:bi-domain-containing oxidoreductase [Chloroflexota bacterium]
MKQVIQSYSTGDLELATVPAPAPGANTILVRTTHSLISVGTERYMLDLAKKSLVGKAMARPDLVRQVINKVRTEGLAEAYRQSMGRLDSPVPLGYSAAGVVTAIGAGVTGFTVGDRVACAGSGIAGHAEILRVPKTLAVKIPDNVSGEAASFVALGGIAMHAVRLATLTFGERVVVLGLGLLGQLAVQIAAAAGCHVFGLDVSTPKVAMACQHGASAGAAIGQEDVLSAVRAFTDGGGADAVLIFASTASNQPIELAAELARVRGKIVVPGLVGLNLPRKLFYEKELDFAVSRAWGPGMYDPDYEAGETDYPLPFVRWTAQRNMAHFLELIGAGRVSVDHLISHRFPIDQAIAAYEMILAGQAPTIGVILQYPEQVDDGRTVWLAGKGQTAAAPVRSSAPAAGAKDHTPHPTVRIGLVGAGLFAKGTLLPALQGIAGAKLHAVATSSGVSGAHLARKYGLAYCTTDTASLLQDPDIDLVMILTRHGSHADLVCKALAAGKHVFVEKPLALNEDQLCQVVEAYRAAPGQLMVGFNRRFAPTTAFVQHHLDKVAHPLMVTVRANIGHIPAEVWVHDPEQGGGNIIGEVCHFVDLIQSLTHAQPVSVSARAIQPAGAGVIKEDNVAMTLTLSDGSIGNIVYTALGDKAYDRERVEVFGGGAVGVIENFRKATWSQSGRRQGQGGLVSSVDRGHRAEMAALIHALQTGRPFPVDFESYTATTRATFAALESLRSGCPVEVH